MMFLWLVLIFVRLTSASGLSTCLDDYVHSPDPYYRWHDTGERVKSFPPGLWSGAVLEMRSQQWLSAADVDCTMWTHQLVVVSPGTIENEKTALLVIGGGNNPGATPSALDELLLLAAAVAVKTGSLAAVVYQVPNQPCHFCAESPRRARYEDDLIAYTWAHFVDHPGDTEWPLRLPMTKAAVRAMDTVQAFASLHLRVQVKGFVVTGASKRGWTTWTTAAVDKRVVGIVPIVMDALNFVPNIHHYYRSLGGWPVAFEPYYSLNLTSYLDSPIFTELMDIVDPYVYRERLTMPKLIVSTSNDEFFMLDDSAYFWDDLPGEKHTLILSNTEHTLLTGLPKLLASIEAFYLSIIEGHELEDKNQASHSHLQMQAPKEKEREWRAGGGGRPKYWWEINRDAGSIEIGATERPTKAILWYAYTPRKSKRRDFRWFTANLGDCPTVVIAESCFQPVFFHHRTLHPTRIPGRDAGTTNYMASISFPKEGFGAFFVELWFTGPKFFMPFIFSTGAAIVPNVFPFADCHGIGCRGVLV